MLRIAKSNSHNIHNSSVTTTSSLNFSPLSFFSHNSHFKGQHKNELARIKQHIDLKQQEIVKCNAEIKRLEGEVNKKGHIYWDLCYYFRFIAIHKYPYIYIRTHYHIIALSHIRSHNDNYFLEVEVKNTNEKLKATEQAIQSGEKNVNNLTAQINDLNKQLNEQNLKKNEVTQLLQNAKATILQVNQEIVQTDNKLRALESKNFELNANAHQ
jgi:septal ring factor EnvC (AmiA/AmiB activator)